MALTNPSSRFDTNQRLKSEYRSAYITMHVERARRAGVPDDILAYDDAEAWYCELVTRISTTTRGIDPEGLTGWQRVEQVREWEEMIRFGLKEYFGIEETPLTGQLVPRMSKLLDLQQRQADHANGR